MEEYDDEFDVCPHCGFAEGTEQENALHMMPGSILEERYIVGKVIGYGGFGVTYIGWDCLLETKVAIKEYLPSEFSTRVIGQTEVTVFSGDKQEQFADGLRKFTDEAKKLAKYHSLNGIVKIFDSIETNNTAYIIMELLEGETLAEMLKREERFSENKTMEMMIPIIESLDLIHNDGIIHRDIAPDNIFVTTSGEVKLIDFGAARYATTTHSRSLTVIIKPGYSPEEQYRSRGDQGPHTDVYAVAATMYKMLTGVTPPDALERRALFENKKKDILDPIRKHCKEIGESRENAILNALNVRIEDRTPDMKEFMAELTSVEPVKRRAGNIKKIDLYKWPVWAKIAFPVITAALIVFNVLFIMGIN
ncbi:MAG: serine/threonine protein kinase, partial [Ruminococcus sp.]|nr:serine/threonine protein kinase [Ruminococcus sp.]